MESFFFFFTSYFPCKWIAPVLYYLLEFIVLLFIIYIFWSLVGENAQYEYSMHFVRHLRTDTINNSNNINEQKLSQRNFYTYFF